jgi:CRISPR-associated protein Cas1
MTSLFVDRRGIHMELDADALVFRENGERVGTVPVAPLTRIFLRGNVTLEAGLLGKLGENGVGVVILTGRQGKPSLMLARPHNDARRRVEQTRLSLDADFCLLFAQQIVHTKLQRQCEWFDELRGHHLHARYELTHAMRLLQDQRQALDKTTSLGSLRGMEGAAASTYFAGLRAVVPDSLQFKGRNRRPPRDPFNVLLSLTYTLVNAEVAMALHAAGFDPCVGFYHQLSFGRESLACDLLEAVRPLADRFCLQLVNKQVLTKDHFSQTSSGCLLGKAGRARYYSAYEEHSEPLRDAIRHSVDELAQTIAVPIPEISDDDDNEHDDAATGEQYA